LTLQPPSGKQDEAKVTLSGIASDAQTAIASVSWQVADSDEWWAAQPADGIYNEPVESFNIATGQLPEEAKQIVVRAWDEAGNTMDQKVRLPWIPEEEVAAEEEKPQGPHEKRRKAPPVRRPAADGRPPLR